jgi:hypothetical protein
MNSKGSDLIGAFLCLTYQSASNFFQFLSRNSVQIYQYPILSQCYLGNIINL